MPIFRSTEEEPPRVNIKQQKAMKIKVTMNSDDLVHAFGTDGLPDGEVSEMRISLSNGMSLAFTYGDGWEAHIEAPEGTTATSTTYSCPDIETCWELGDKCPTCHGTERNPDWVEIR